MSSRTLELNEREQHDLQLACLGRISAISDLIGATRDHESKDELKERRQRLEALLDRLGGRPL